MHHVPDGGGRWHESIENLSTLNLEHIVVTIFESETPCSAQQRTFDGCARKIIHDDGVRCVETMVHREPSFTQDSLLLMSVRSVVSPP